jgi:hypothetical protein
MQDQKLEEFPCGCVYKNTAFGPLIRKACKLHSAMLAHGKPISVEECKNGEMYTVNKDTK